MITPLLVAPWRRKQVPQCLLATPTAVSLYREPREAHFYELPKVGTC